MGKPVKTPKVRQIAENENSLLEIVLIADVCRKAPSEMLSIADELTAFCFNAAATVRKMEWENKRDLLRLQETKFMTRQAISEAFGGEVAPPISFEDDKSGEIDPSSPDVW